MRQIDILVLSDLHLGTYGAHAEDLNNYLKSINPKTLILNGDIIDMWSFKKRYFPKAHWDVLKTLLEKLLSGTVIYYLTGNHDDRLRKISDISIGQFHLADKLVLDIDGQSHWFFHGDVFDASINHSKLIAKLGAKAYDLLILTNRIINRIRIKLGLSPLSFSKKVKKNVKQAISLISDFEETAIGIGIENKYDYVICGHIHQPTMRKVHKSQGSITYMNSGDWVESLTSLEYTNKQWKIYNHLAEQLTDQTTLINKSSSEYSLT